MISAIRRQAGLVGACACGMVLAVMLVLATGSDPLASKLVALAHLFH
jgi:hypothetical protein